MILYKYNLSCNKSLQRYNKYGEKENFLRKNYVISFFFRTFVAGNSTLIKYIQ